MIRRNKRGKLQISGFYVKFVNIDFYKLFLNLLVLTLLGFTIWSAIKLFLGEFLHSPLIGSIVFFVEIIAFVLLCRHFRANKWRSPNIVVTALVFIAMLVVMVFAGVEPLSTYKNNTFTNVSSFLSQNVKSSNAINNKSSTPSVDEKDVVNLPKIMETPKLVDTTEIIERGVLDLVNKIRISRKTSPLIWNDQLYAYSKSRGE